MVLPSHRKETFPRNNIIVLPCSLAVSLLYWASVFVWHTYLLAWPTLSNYQASPTTPPHYFNFRKTLLFCYYYQRYINVPTSCCCHNTLCVWSHHNQTHLSMTLLLSHILSYHQFGWTKKNKRRRIMKKLLWRRKKPPISGTCTTSLC